MKKVLEIEREVKVGVQFPGQVIVKVLMINGEKQEEAEFRFDPGIIPTVKEIKELVEGLDKKLKNDEFDNLKGLGYRTMKTSSFRGAIRKMQKLNEQLRGKHIIPQPAGEQ